MLWARSMTNVLGQKDLVACRMLVTHIYHLFKSRRQRPWAQINLDFKPNSISTMCVTWLIYGIVYKANIVSVSAMSNEKYYKIDSKKQYDTAAQTSLDEVKSLLPQVRKLYTSSAHFEPMSSRLKQRLMPSYWNWFGVLKMYGRSN